MIIDVHAQVGKHPLYGFEQTAEEIVADMQRYGIDKSFLLPVPRMRFAEANNVVASAVKKYKGKFVGFLNVNPSEPTATNDDRLVRGRAVARAAKSRLCLKIYKALCGPEKV